MSPLVLYICGLEWTYSTFPFLPLHSSLLSFTWLIFKKSLHWLKVDTFVGILFWCCQSHFKVQITVARNHIKVLNLGIVFWLTAFAFSKCVFRGCDNSSPLSFGVFVDNSGSLIVGWGERRELKSIGKTAEDLKMNQKDYWIFCEVLLPGFYCLWAILPFYKLQ